MDKRLPTFLCVIIFGVGTYLAAPCRGDEQPPTQNDAAGKSKTLDRIAQQPSAVHESEAKPDLPKFTFWEPAALDRAFPRDAKLTEIQRGFRNWSEGYFPGCLDESWRQNLSQKEKTGVEEKWLRQLSSSDESARIQAIKALASIGSKKAVPDVLKIATERVEKSNADRCEAARALGIIGERSAVPELVHLTYHFNKNTRLWAQISLVRLTGENFGRDIGAWKSWWEKQGGMPPISAETVTWATSPELAKWADPQKQDETDRQYAGMPKDRAKDKETTGQAVPPQSGRNPPTQSIVEGKWKIIERIGKGFVADENRPDDFPDLQKELSEAERLENFDILWKAIDRHYSFFDLKKINWQVIKTRYIPKVKAATNSDEYYRLLFDLVRELKDFHSYPYNYKIYPPGFRPDVSVCLIEGKAVVTFVSEGSGAYVKGLRPGTVITHVDGLSVEEQIEQFRPQIRACSSERFFQAMAHHCLLSGERQSKAKLTFLPPGAEIAEEAELQRTARMLSPYTWQTFEVKFPVEKGKFIWSGTHPSGYGYIRIVTFNGREEIADEFDRTLEKLKDSPGLIVDVRDNDGGSGVSQSRIMGRLITAKTKVIISFQKNGAGHKDFSSRASEISPCGGWQYTKPVVLLTNEITGSASDLFTCQMRGTGRVITVGTTTHGDLPGHNVFAVLPCGLVVRISSAYVADINGRIIEVNGNAPQIRAAPTVKDVIDGTDSVLDRAVKALHDGVSPSAAGCDDPGGICAIPGQKLPIIKSAPSNKNDIHQAEYDQKVPLEFALADTYGREVRSSDYRGVPVLITSGACWCAHCQGDADLLPHVVEKYRARGLQVIRSASYDGALPAWEFHKHYRLPCVQLLDPIRELDKRYNIDGWPFLMLVDKEGKVIFRKNIEIGDYWAELARLLEAMLPERSKVETIRREGVWYMPATLKRSGEMEKTRQIERFPSLACADDGRIYVAFTTNRGGTQDVYLRVFDGKKWLPDRPIAATEADEFDGTVIVDQHNRPWVSWTSNAGGPPYNIFVTCASESSAESAPTQITHSDPQDGKMHARMAVDAQGRIWATYYQWERIKNMGTPVQDRELSLFSHQWDKEVYARYLEQDHWSDEIHVTPEDNVPTDDHTDPTIAAIVNGVVIGWSWDFHQRNNNRAYSNNKISDYPTIFLRNVEPGPKFERARAVSGANVDSHPTIAAGPDGRVFCAWESAMMNQKGGGTMKMVAASVEDLQQEEQPSVGTNVTGPQKDICTPCLAVSPKGDVSLVWAEFNPKSQWTLMQAHWDEKKNSWNKPKIIVAKGNPRFPSAAYAKDGKLWVAYCVDNKERREIATLKVE